MERWWKTYLKASSREQWLLVLSFIAVTALILMKVAWEPLWQRQQLSRDAWASLAADLKAMEAERDALSAAVDRDVDEVKRQENQSLRERVDAQQKLLGAGLRRLVTPEEMLGLLAGLLAEHPGLLLSEVKKLPATRATELQVGNDVALFTHRVRFVVKGRYLDTLRYIGHVEERLPRLRLATLDYQVQDYPLAEVILEWETLGIDERWLGIQ